MYEWDAVKHGLAKALIIAMNWIRPAIDEALPLWRGSPRSAYASTFTVPV